VVDKKVNFRKSVTYVKSDGRTLKFKEYVMIHAYIWTLVWDLMSLQDVIILIWYL